MTDPSNRDTYSRFDLALPALRPWLSGAPAPIEDFAGLWFSPAEPGWGLTVAQAADGRAFVTWYTYADDGRPAWLYAPDPVWKSAVALEGALYRSSGASPMAGYDPARFASRAVGSLRIDFGHGSAVARLTVDGVTRDKPLTRLLP